MKIAIIGAGWYGCHLALKLRELGHEITIYEKNNDIFSGISGSFGIRLHSGTHYPRSENTRKSCRQGFDSFKNEYLALVVNHKHSFYGLGEKDSTGKPSHVDKATFADVCREFKSGSVEEIAPEEHGYQNLLSAFDFDEPSIKLGTPLREFFKTKLEQAGVKIQCNTSVTQLESVGDRVELLITKDGITAKESFDKGINTTSYQSLLPDSPPPFPFEVTYQPCLGLIYKSKKHQEKPFSFIVMDGFFPCIMPLVDRDKGDDKYDKYLLTHGEFTILASCKTPEKAEELFKKTVNDEYIKTHVKPRCEAETKKFLKSFSDDFEFAGWQGTVLAKLKTKTEFRSALTYGRGNIIYVIPGKVSNIFDVENEVRMLLNPDNNIIVQDNYSYVMKGVLARSIKDITDIPTPTDDRATTSLQTHHFFSTGQKVQPSSAELNKPTLNEDTNRLKT